MTLLKDISIIWSLLHTLVLFMLLFESRYPKKKTMVITLSTMLPLILINFVLYMICGQENYNTLMLLTLSLPSAVVFWILAKNRDGRFFFIFCMVDTLVLEIVYITQILNNFISPDTYIFMFAVRMAIYPILELLVYKFFRPIFLDVQRHIKKGWGVSGVIGLLFYLAITLLMTVPTPIVERPEYLPVMGLLFLLMPFVYIHIITTLRHQQRLYELAEEENILRLQASNVLERVEELSEANERFREERHNFRHKMKAIASLVETEQYEELALLVEDYKEAYQKTVVKRYCKNAVIDAVLSAYIKRAESRNIAVTVGLDFPEVISANETELATALANAIENAIHACEKLPVERRFIEIKVISKPQFIVMVKNSFDGRAEFDENGIPVNHDEGHGLGTRSIAAFCNKIGGYYQFRAEGEVFTLYMHLK